MRQVLVHKKAVFLKELAEPLPTAKKLVVRVHYSFISSGTESATINTIQSSLFEKISKKPREMAQKIITTTKEIGIQGTLSLIQENLEKLSPIGYSCAGEVVHVGDGVSGFKIGDFVACAGAHFAHHADFVSVPEKLAAKLSCAKKLKEASITTIGAIALQGVRRAQLALGETVCVAGLGLIGLITVQLAKRAGCKVIALDIVKSKLEKAKALGADKTILVSDNFTQEILFATQHVGADATIITAASQSGSLIQQAMEFTRKKGKVVLVGDVKIDFDRNPFYAKEIDFLVSCSYGPGRYDDSYELQGIDYPYAYVRWTENRNMQLFVDMLEDDALDVSSLISHEYDIEQVDQAYNSLKNNTTLGVVLSYTSQEKKFEIENQFTQETEEFSIKPYIAPQGTILIGIIGAGGFARVKLLPIIKNIKGTAIRSIIDVDIVHCMNMARAYNASQISNNYQKILVDDAVKAVVIATPHALHTEQALDCLKAGKAVFVEKPAAINVNQLQQLQDFFSVNNSSLYCVDFNRSFSPFMTSIKEVIAHRSNPMIITYRINAQFIPPGHWVTSEAHGGRIIGEACHIFELFCFLTDAKPLTIGVNVLNAQEPYSAGENFSTHLRMSDGSLCTLIYSAMGNASCGKEYMELQCDGKTIIMDDFIHMYAYGLPISFNKKSAQQDKGHEQLLRLFFQAARTSPALSPLPFSRIYYATQISLIVTKLAQQGGGFYLFDQEEIAL